MTSIPTMSTRSDMAKAVSKDGTLIQYVPLHEMYLYTSSSIGIRSDTLVHVDCELLYMAVNQNGLALKYIPMRTVQTPKDATAPPFICHTLVMNEYISVCKDAITQNREAAKFIIFNRSMVLNCNNVFSMLDECMSADGQVAYVLRRHPFLNISIDAILKDYNTYLFDTLYDTTAVQLINDFKSNLIKLCNKYTRIALSDESADGPRHGKRSKIPHKYPLPEDVISTSSSDARIVDLISRLDNHDKHINDLLLRDNKYTEDLLTYEAYEANIDELTEKVNVLSKQIACVDELKSQVTYLRRTTYAIWFIILVVCFINIYFAYMPPDNVNEQLRAHVISTRLALDKINKQISGKPTIDNISGVFNDIYKKISMQQDNIHALQTTIVDNKMNCTHDNVSHVTEEDGIYDEQDAAHNVFISMLYSILAVMHELSIFCIMVAMASFLSFNINHASYDLM